MNKRILRRDFLNGITVAVAASLVPQGRAQEQPFSPETAPGYYPPLKTGMRGSHPGSFEVAHEMRDKRQWDLGSAINTQEKYDLVIVGAGMSGLSAAYFFLKNIGPGARVLVLDNHDDFGGHAKRNEFEYHGRTLVLNGGTLNIECPDFYNAPAKQLLKDLGIDLPRYLSANAKNGELYGSLNLGYGYFFDKETWGADRLVKMDTGIDAYGGSVSAGFLAKTPLSEQAQKDVLRLFDPKQPDYLDGHSSPEKKALLARMSYTDYILKVAKADKQALWMFEANTQGLFCVKSDAVPALYCWNMGFPGFGGLNLEPTPDGMLAELPGGQHGRQKPREGGGEIHFPDGNATIARLMVRWLIPDGVPGKSMEDVGMARVNYALLDRPDQPARIRLNSTVVNVSHDGPVEKARGVSVTYVRGGKTYQVRSAACVMACWNMFIPDLVPELPTKQKNALAYGVKSPLVYTSVALRNWKAFQKLGISGVSAPGMYHYDLSLSEAVSLGDLKHPQTPEDPIVVHMERTPCAPGKPKNDQFRLGRAELLATSFETCERKIRDQFARTLGSGGFDPAEDIIAITVNRWPHGYAFAYNSLYDPMEWAFTSTNTRPCVVGRQPYGLISIANSDAAASSHTDAAILEAYRAIQEVIEQRGMPMFKLSGSA
jgi:spermidine dehydrogenase